MATWIPIIIMVMIVIMNMIMAMPTSIPMHKSTIVGSRDKLQRIGAEQLQWGLVCSPGQNVHISHISRNWACHSLMRNMRDTWRQLPHFNRAPSSRLAILQNMQPIHLLYIQSTNAFQCIAMYLLIYSVNLLVMLCCVLGDVQARSPPRTSRWVWVSRWGFQWVSGEKGYNAGPKYPQILDKIHIFKVTSDYWTDIKFLFQEFTSKSGLFLSRFARAGERKGGRVQAYSLTVQTNVYKI